MANDAENARRIYRALATFGAPLERLTVEDLVSDGLIFQIGVAPIRIDVITSVSGVSFEEAWPSRVGFDFAGVAANVIGRAELIRNKRAAGRLKDLADIERLEHDG